MRSVAVWLRSLGLVPSHADDESILRLRVVGHGPVADLLLTQYRRSYLIPEWMRVRELDPAA